MNNQTNIFMSVSFKHRNAQVAVIKTLEEIARSFGMKSYVFVNQYELKGDNYHKMMKVAFSKIKNSRLLIAELSHQSIGVGIEIGYAKAMNIPVLYIHKKGSSLSTTTMGTCDKYLQYTDVKDLRKRLPPILAAFK